VQELEIEFLDPEPAEDAPPPAPVARRPAPIREWAQAGLWLAAAALAVGACLGTVYSVDVRQGGDLMSWSLDAWGRYGTTSDTLTLGHGPRIAVLMLAGAALLITGAALAALRRAPLAPVATAVGIAGLAVTATVAAALLLDYSSVQDTYDAQNRDQDTPGNLVSNIVNLSVRLGPGTWLILTSAACGLAALAATLLLRARPVPEPG
jgi:ABC-type Fe3+-siderophore transport system permease subunit